VHADEAGSWDNLHERFEVKRINHQEAYSLDGACTNWAEEYFSRLRRAEIGVHHHIAGAYLLRYAQESLWREDNRCVSNGDQVNRVAALGSKAWWFRVRLFPVRAQSYGLPIRAGMRSRFPRAGIAIFRSLSARSSSRPISRCFW
jgi:hypothetical protein